MPTGYSGTPLAKKLGLKPGQRAWFDAMPDSVRGEIDPGAIGLVLLDEPNPGLDLAHVFVTTRAGLERHIALLRDRLAADGMIWVSWPKKASKVPTDITEDVVRAVALPTGLVDVKVCAVDEIWSGLKLVIRKALRTA
ncbi:hypothetical protein U1839_25720 [Sphingomonas sp. RT2P30]|uniref:hypothetical protein n=1 Tax=Parasphingomonas halimpatiens TaxID=3096162 RepID=UPI002FCBD52E